MKISKSFAIALTLGLSTWWAAPALAQQKAANGTEPQPTVTLKVHVGPAGELGYRGLTSTRTQTKTSGSTTPGTDARTSTTTTPTQTTTTVEGGLGVQYGGDATWWALGRFGVGLSLFGAWLPSSQTNTVMHLNGQDSSTYKNETKTETGGTTSTTTMTDTTTIAFVSPFGGGGTTHAVTIGIPAAGATGALTTTYTAGGAAILTLRQGDTAAANPKSNFKSEGGMAFTNNRTFMVNDVALHGDYVLARGRDGEVVLLGGVTVPIVQARHAFTAKTVGAGGQGNTAKETEAGFKADGQQTFQRVTETTINNSVTAETSMLVGGPVFGLNAAYRLAPTIQLYTQLGYAPVLGGSATTTTVTQTSTKTVATVTGATADAPAGTTNGSTTAETATSTTTPAIGAVTGTSAHGSVGVGFQVGPATLYFEGNARGYSIAGVPEVIYGIRLGAGMGF